MPPETANDLAWTEPVLVRSGLFDGRWMSFSLEVAQQPVHGRRKTEKDRRPLAPSPVVRLWLREHTDGDSPGVPVDPADIEVSLLVCAADVAPPTGRGPPSPASAKSTKSTSPAMSSNTVPEDEGESDHEPTTSTKTKPPVAGRNIYGNLHVAGVRVPAREGGVGLWFLFTDLCMRTEGTYSLKFRCFDISAIDTASAPGPALVSTRSADFTVYSPRNFPGLPKPTELADHFAKQGYKLNTRKNERQAASPSPDK